MEALALWSGRAVQLLCSESGCSHSQQNSWVCTHIATHVPLQYFSSEKTLPVGYFHSLRGLSLLQAEVWNRLIFVNCSITKMIFRRNVKAQRLKNNKLEKWLSYSFLTQFAVPEEVENVKYLNAFHRNYLERINNISKQSQKGSGHVHGKFLFRRSASLSLAQQVEGAFWSCLTWWDVGWSRL